MSQPVQRPQPPQTLQFAGFRVDLHARELRRNGNIIRLQEQPFSLLAVLLEHAGDVVTREELRQHLWPSDTFVDFDNSLNTAVNKIREALGDSAESPRFVETLPRRGYRFMVPVTSGDRIAKKAGAHASGLRWKIIFGIAAGLIGIASFAGIYLRWTTSPLTEKDTLVLTDFANTTGDSVFDDVLK